MWNTCTACGDQFEVLPSQASWRRLCMDCFKAQKRSELEGLQDQVVRLQSEVTRLRTELQSRSDEIDPKRIRQLLQLCHPDKHNNSQLSHDVTAWLNGLR